MTLAARPGTDPSRARGLSLRWRLSVSFAGIAALAALVLGAVIVPVLASHYSTAERTYLEAAAERAVRDLSTISWRDRAALEESARQIAVLAQARVRLIDTTGAILADVPAPSAVEPPPAVQPLPNPLGVTLLGDTPSPASLPRSDQRVSRPVNKPDKAGAAFLGTVELSEPPAYERVALANVAIAWAVAGLLAVVVAAAVGVAVASRITRPIERLTAAADRMASGELGARTGLRREDELGRLAASFDEMAGRMEETVTTLRRFVADAAHEIGTPLTALQADLDLAEAHAATGDERRLIGRATTQAQRLGELTRDLLGLSRLEAADHAVASREPVDLGILVRQVADAFDSRARQAGVALSVEGSDRVVVAGSQERLRVAVEHLVENAVKFTPAGGRVMAGVGQADGLATVWVADTGPGIPADELPHVFERFRRGRGAGARPGSGLGLAIVRATAELHGGTAVATSSPGGSRFELRLPRE